MTPRERGDGQVVAAAAAMDRVLAAGLPEAVLVELVRARAVWHETGRVEWSPLLAAALEVPAVRQWDELFAAAVGRSR